MRTAREIEQQRHAAEAARGGAGTYRHQVGTSAAGGAVRALGYLPPQDVRISTAQAQQIGMLMQRGLTVVQASQRVLGQHATSNLEAGANLIVIDAAAGGAVGAVVGAAVGNPFAGALVGAGIGALVGFIQSLLSGKPKPKETRLPQNPPRPPVSTGLGISAQLAQAAGLKPGYKVYDLTNQPVGGGATTSRSRVQAPHARAQQTAAQQPGSVLSRIGGEIGQQILRAIEGMTPEQFGHLTGELLDDLFGQGGLLQGTAIGEAAEKLLDELDGLAEKYFHKPLYNLLGQGEKKLVQALCSGMHSPLSCTLAREDQERPAPSEPLRTRQIRDIDNQLGQVNSPLWPLVNQLTPDEMTNLDYQLSNWPKPIPRLTPQDLQTLSDTDRPMSYQDLKQLEQQMQRQPYKPPPFQPIEYQPQQPPPPPSQQQQQTQQPLQNIPQNIPQQGDCSTPDSPIGQLAKLLVNCPTFQHELTNKFKVSKPTQLNRQPQLKVAEPTCLCCDSEEDLQLYLETGGSQGNCTQTAGADADMVSATPSNTEVI